MNVELGVKRFDLGEIREAQRTPQGFLKVPGFATRTGVFPYVTTSGKMRYELRHPDDVFDPKSMATLQGAPVTIEHPPKMLNPTNVAQYRKGHASDRVEVNRDLLETDLIVEDQDAIDAIEKEHLRELSSGYVSDVVEEAGVYNDTPYTHRQKNIQYNHIAIVRRGRAGPEVRMHLDSADAVMQELSPPVPTRAQVSQQESSVDRADAPLGNTPYVSPDADVVQPFKKVVISGEEIELPSRAADVIQDCLDRYDEMRAEVTKLKEDLMNKQQRTDSAEPAKKTDVDVSQPGVSPQVSVVQMAPDGRASAGKSGPGDKGGVAAAKGDADPADKKDGEKKDADESPADKIKKDMDDLKKDFDAKYDSMQAKLDSMANASMGAGEKKGDAEEDKEKKDAEEKERKDSIRERVKLERQAEKLVPADVANRFDSMSDDEVRAAVIKHSDPRFDSKGKSSVYLQARFDTMLASIDDGESTRKAMGRELMAPRMDAEEKADPAAARLKMIQESRQGWTQPLTAQKK